MGIDRCPNCDKALNQTSNRLVKEGCGHDKCRQCFLYEDNGCRQCKVVVAPGTSTFIHEDQPNHKSKPCKIKSEWAKMSTNIKEPKSGLAPRIDPSSVFIDRNVIGDMSVAIMENRLKDVSPKEPSLKSDKFVILSDVTIIPSGIDITIPSELVPPKKVRAHVRNHELPDHIWELNDGKGYQCHGCEKVLKTRDQCYYHIFCNGSVSKPYSCDVCPRMFVTANHLAYHKQTHTRSRNHGCSFCDRKFQSKTSLSMHSRKMHSEDLRFKCSQCDKAFVQKSHLANHEKIHSNVTPFKCDKCPKSFRLKENLTKHLITHSDDKKFSCKECGDQFKRNSTLKIHQMRHVGLKTLGPCEHCGKVFYHEYNYKRHLQMHKQEQTFVCPICQARCNRKDNFYRHLKAIHQEEDIDAIFQRVTKAPTEVVKEKTIPSPSSNQFNYPRSCTVIKSIGKARPLDIIPQTENSSSPPPHVVQLPTNEPIKFKISMLKNTLESPPPTSKFQVDNRPNISDDRLEIYRKILLPSTDDDEDPGHYDQNQLEHHEDDSTKYIHPMVHWRKRTSQCFTLQGGGGQGSY